MWFPTFSAPRCFVLLPGACARLSGGGLGPHLLDDLSGDPASGIGRAKLDGTGVDADFISGISPGQPRRRPRPHLLDAATRGATIGRAKLDGTAVDNSFISGLHGVHDVAVDHDHIYWTGAGPEGTIGRARIDGTGADESFITGVGDPGRGSR